MQRRKFLKSTCNSCLMVSAGLLFGELVSCSPSTQVFKAPVVDKSVSVPLTLFLVPGVQLVRPQGWYYDIAVQKKDDQNFTALLLKCTHQQNQLVRSSNGYTCNLHGSQYNLDGTVIKGPAEFSLKHFTTTVNQNQLVIHLI
jgi:Rieske Fe-S protein